MSARSNPEIRASLGGNGDREGRRIHTKVEAAQILRVKVSWLERRAAARQIPFTMLGGSYHFTDAHIDEIVRLNEQGAPTGPAPSARPRRRSKKAGSPPPPNRSSGFVPLRPRPMAFTNQQA